MCSGRADRSAMTSTSEGPAGMSMEIMASLLDSSILAAVTYWLPGPKILSTCTRHSFACCPQMRSNISMYGQGTKYSSPSTTVQLLMAGKRTGCSRRSMNYKNNP